MSLSTKKLHTPPFEMCAHFLPVSVMQFYILLSIYFCADIFCVQGRIGV